MPLLSVLPGGPSPAQIAAGTLRDASGQTVTCSRASNKYCVNASGGLTLLSSNQIAVEPNGILVEAGATNLAKQSQAVGTTSPWGVVGSTPPAAPTVTANTSDVPDPTGSSHTAAKLVFPATTTSEQYTLAQQTFTSAASTAYTISFFIHGAAPSTFHFAIDGLAAGPQASATVSVTTSWQRVSLRWTSTAGGSATLNIGSDTRAGNANQPTQAAQTVYIWGVQIEAGTFASSYIPTTTTTASRDADTVSAATITLTSTYAWTADMVLQGLPAPSTFPDLGRLANGSQYIDNFLDSSGNLNAAYWNGSALAQALQSGISSAGVKYHLVAKYDGVNIYASVNGASTGAAGEAILAGSYTPYIGNAAGANQLNGWLSNIKIFNTPNAAG